MTKDELLGFYWFENTSVHDLPQLGLDLYVGTPTLVELFASGKVRGVLGESYATEGFLPPSFFTLPYKHRGLMLYARRNVELYNAPTGGIPIGTVYRGALVSVVPTENLGRIPVGSFQFDEFPVGFVDRNAMGIEPYFRDFPHKGGLSLSKLGYAVATGSPRLQFCRDVWIRDRGANWVVSQFVDGIELFADVEAETFEWARQPTWHGVLEACPAHAVVLRENHHKCISPARSMWDAPAIDEISSIPETYRHYVRPNEEPLRRAIEQSGKVQWLRFTEDGPVCDEWGFSAVKKQLREGNISFVARLTRTKQVITETGKVTAWYTAEFEPSDGVSLARLRLGPLRYENRAATKCNCTYTYALLQVEGDELTMMGRALPADVLAYNASEAERWYLSREACQLAVSEITEKLATDGTLATQVGFHAYESR